MKSVTFAIMAILIFGVATAPVFSNGEVFAQTQKEVAIEKKENTAAKKETSTQKKDESVKQKQYTADDPTSTKKDVAVSQKEATAAKKETSTQKKETSIEKKSSTAEKKQISKEQYRANNKEQKTQLKERFANMPDEIKRSLQKKIDAMKEKHDSNTQKSNQHPDFADWSKKDKQAKLQEIRDNISAKRELYQNMTTVDKLALDEQRIEKMKEKRETYVSPRDQVSLGLEPSEIICDEGKELVIKVSNGMPMCLGEKAVIVLMDRGIITYPE